MKVVGYDVIRRDRTVNGRFGGGVCFYIHSEINYAVREDLDSQLLEILSVETHRPNSKPFVVPRGTDRLIHLLTFSEIDSLLVRLDCRSV